MDDVVVDAVLDEGSAVLHAEQPLRVGFVFREQQRRLALAIEITLAQLGFVRPDDATADRWRLASSTGRGLSLPHDHRLRNHSVGST